MCFCCHLPGLIVSTRIIKHEREIEILRHAIPGLFRHCRFKTQRDRHFKHKISMNTALPIKKLCITSILALGAFKCSLGYFHSLFQNLKSTAFIYIFHHFNSEKRHIIQLENICLLTPQKYKTAHKINWYSQSYVKTVFMLA